MIVRKAFWLLATIAFPLFFLVVLWISMSSAYFIRIQDMRFDPATGTITLERVVLSRSDVLARWHLSVQLPPGQTLPDGRSECSDSDTAIYEPRYADGTMKTTASFVASDDLLPCLMVPDVQVVGAWQVLWAGLIPLKPTYFFKPPRS